MLNPTKNLSSVRPELNEMITLPVRPELDDSKPALSFRRATANQNKKKENVPTAQLLIGEHEYLAKHTKQMLQEIFCQNNSCKICSTCKQIQDTQHIGSIWLKPEKSYTRDQIQIIFDTIAFKLEENQKLFFVIQNADSLNDACSNSLLKSIEEPPAGYHFILLAERKNQILPTIQSRCIIKSFYKNNETVAESDIVNIFTSSTNCMPDAFLKIFESENITEKDTLEVLDKILGHWLKESKTALLANNQEKYNFANNKIKKLKKAIEMPPMPGSNKIFWNNLYLQLN